MERVSVMLGAGWSVVFEGQMRIAFVLEALTLARIEHARIVLVDCDDATRTRRLRDDRRQPELANEDMMKWSRYLRREAEEAGCFILDTGAIPFDACRDRVIGYLVGS